MAEDKDKEQLTDYIDLNTENIQEAFDDEPPKKETESPVLVSQEADATNGDATDAPPSKEAEEEETKAAEEEEQVGAAAEEVEEEEKYTNKHADDDIDDLVFKKEELEPKLHAQPGTEDKEKRLEAVEEAVAAKDDDIEVETILIRRIYDKDSLVPDKVHNHDPERQALNAVDPKWKYNITLGDLELRKITHYDGKEETLWFPMEKYPDDYVDPFDVEDDKKKDKKKDGEKKDGEKKDGKKDEKKGEKKKDDKKKKKKKKPTPPRKVFVALKVKRVSAVDNIAETFRMRFHMYFNWLPTETDYKSYYRASKEAKQQNKPQILMDWEPRWYPHLEFQNMIEEHTREWELYPEEGYFRIQNFKDFAQDKGQKMPDDQFDCTKAKFLRAKLECEMTFAEELELQSFPFDCQDLSCIIHERTTGGVRCVFLPELRKPNFGSIDPRYSVIDEWDLETAIIEFGDADPNASRGKVSYAMIVLRLKMKRRWKVFFANIVFLMACISLLALTAFSLDEGDLGDRLNLLITLILTAVAFSYVVFDALPNVPYLTYMDKYILGSYGFLVGLMIQTAMIRQPWLTPEVDAVIFYLSIAWLIAFNVGFGIYGYYLRKDEFLKLSYSSDEVEKEVNLSRPGLRFDYTKRMRAGINGRLLSFIGYTHASHHMDEKQKAELQRKQEDLDKLFQTQRSFHGYDASEVPQSPSTKPLDEPLLKT